MTAVQQNAMNTELWKSIGAIADNEPLMRRLTRYAKRLAKENHDSTLMTREEFFARVDHSLNQAKEGKVNSITNKKELEDFLNNL